MKNYFFYLALFISGLLWAQDQSEMATDTISWNTESYFSLDLSSPLLAGEISRYNLGYVHHLKNRWKIGAHIGYGNQNISIIDTQEDYRFFELRPTLYYFTNPERKAPIYYGLELYYVNQQETRFFGQFRPEQGGPIQNYDRADFTREKYGLNLTFGVIANISERLKINFFYGIGPRVRQISYSNIENQRPANFADDDGWFPAGGTFEGYALGLDINIGLKLFYSIK